MGARDGKSYISRLKAHPREVWVAGRKVDDVTTDPAFRRRGLHSALLVRRLRDARAEGVYFVCGDAEFLSTSHRNMERAGMRLLFLRAIWTAVA